MKIYALCIERKIIGRKTSQEYVRRSYSKLLTSSNAETKAWRWNETKRTLFPADEVTALSKDGQLSTKTTLSIYSTEIIPQGNRHECEGYGKQKPSWNTGPATMRIQAEHTGAPQTRARRPPLSGVPAVSSSSTPQLLSRLKTTVWRQTGVVEDIGVICNSGILGQLCL